MVEDEATRATAREVAECVAGAGAIEDRLCVKPEWGAEAEAKQTEFGTEASARAMTGGDFEKIV
jgi:hypothetical protein